MFEKKTYLPPTLISLGSLSELTRDLGSGDLSEALCALPSC